MSVAQALPFYRDFLGFALDWEHRFEPTLPLYVQISRSTAVLHLCSPDQTRRTSRSRPGRAWRARSCGSSTRTAMS
ncbi:glyoxalase superfamily protein [Streptomyces sparsogenes]|uniref:glyoxalase superfamily protein n=1 Tax=Streptomyces sparsogenes TaxID=67365 RepID=UPI00340F3E6A